ncbi:hypothetical protein C8T65DRAFT_736752 [Cerioporus squamosus]|nr:hypothetical protein C8T65DRAFT_736752 [Cerioporus squamosus]
MATACLQSATTYTQLACFLAGEPHNAADYNVLEDNFIMDMQAFQRVYQAGEGRRHSHTPGAGYLLHASPASTESPPSPPSHGGNNRASEPAEDTLWDIDDLVSMGSQQSDKQWDAAEDFYSRTQISLVADLQDPLFEQLHQLLADSLIAPLLEELTSPMEECLMHAPFLDAIATRLLHTLRPALLPPPPSLATLRQPKRISVKRVHSPPTDMGLSCKEGKN